jgi:hypothetical protein
MGLARFADALVAGELKQPKRQIVDNNTGTAAISSGKTRFTLRSPRTRGFPSVMTGRFDISFVLAAYR